MPVEVRGRDERIFGGGRKEKKKEPEPTVEMKDAMSQLGPDSTVLEYKQMGNRLVSNGSYTLAVKYYASAIERADPNCPSDQLEVLFSNRSAAYLQCSLLSGPSMALKDADRAINAKPDWFKGYLRKGDALFAVEKYEQAIEAYAQCLERNPDCDTAKESKRSCEVALFAKQQEGSPKKGKSSLNNSFEASGGAGGVDEEPHHFRKPPPVHSPVTKEEKKDLQDATTAETLLNSWTKDTDVQAERPAHKPRSVELTNVDRTEGQALKNSWLNSYKKKKETDATVQAKAENAVKESQLSGASYDYKTKTGGGQYDLANGTDAVGRAILADAYKDHIGTDRKW